MIFARFRKETGFLLQFFVTFLLTKSIIVHTMYRCLFCAEMMDILQLIGDKNMAKKENQRIILTKRLLQEGLLRLLEIKELDKISVTELCKESGINRATFYNHYCSPQDLLTDLEVRLTEEMNQLIRTPVNMEEMTDQLESLCVFYQENARSILILARCHSDADLADVFNNLNQQFRRQQLSAHRAANLDDDSFHLVSTFLYTGCYHLIREWLVKDIQKTPREIAELVLSLVSKDFL